MKKAYYWYGFNEIFEIKSNMSGSYKCLVWDDYSYKITAVNQVQSNEILTTL